MNIDEMSDQEKSVLLAKAMGWTVHEFAGLQADIFAPPDKWVERGSLYDPANMALAWRVLNWAFKGDDLGEILAQWWEDEWDIYFLDPADAQRLWLDKILELAIEAGLVEVDA